jgi:hypothetical protein
MLSVNSEGLEIYEENTLRSSLLRKVRISALLGCGVRMGPQG